MKDGIKIIKAEVTNFKNIEAKSVDLGGKSFVILGKNGAGKSSLIQAIMSPLDSRYIPQAPVRNGEEKGTIEVVIAGEIGGETIKYFVELYFTPGNQKGRVVVRNAEGETVSAAKSLVKSIVGNIGFDIFDFISLGLTKDGKISKPGVKQQIEILRGFMSDEAKNQLGELERTYKEKYDKRTFENGKIDEAEAFMKNSTFEQGEIDKYSEPKDATVLEKQLGDLSNTIIEWDKVSKGIEEDKAEAEKAKAQGEMSSTARIIQDKLQVNVQTIEGLKESERWKSFIESYNALRKELQDIATEGANGLEEHDRLLQQALIAEEHIKATPRPSAEGINQQLTAIREHNANYDKIKEYVEKQRQIMASKEASNTLTTELTDIDTKKKQLFATSELPVKGLTFTEDEILYNGLPFNENQHPKSTIIGIGVKIAMAMNPNLKVLVIRDGSLLDSEMLQTVVKMANKYDFQILVEIVKDGIDDVEVQFVEDYLKP